ncbi:MAG: leucine--tRNA ligase [Firmicutes bacterium]|nr:leucine--tRNA ligase [Bacillota bacterium]
MAYDFQMIEKKWQAFWERNKREKNNNKPKFYCLDMFPYPSGSGLHVGHWRGYVLSDSLARYKILNGYEILHPMGWDAFGLPAENYAIKNKTHPAISTKENIENAKRQLKEIGAVYDWDREVNTTDPEYYKWTQWIFLKMFEKGLAYEKEMPLNWCPNCKAVLANEEATNGICDRCGSSVTKKMLRQWMLKITDYADRLLEDLDLLDWPQKVKKMQADWIGKSFGASVNFKVCEKDLEIEIFTTRPDTLYGATFLVLAPEHELIKKLVSNEKKDEVEEYIKKASEKSYVDRMADKEKTGVFTGAYAINPLNKKKIPIWISDYVLADYATGAIMCVPAHDDRDFEFAKKFNLEIIEVIKDNKLINSGKFNDLDYDEARKKIIDRIEKLKIGKRQINYKLRDWIFSRQRYWGEPIPIIHCEKCGLVPVDEKDLPVLLPEIENYEPTETGESPLAKIESWVNIKCPKCGGKAKRETNTMPQWAGSSWYFLRYVDNKNKFCLADKDLLKKWMPVDYYVGGIEHAVLHLLYARFYTKFLYDIGVIDFKEPFLKLFNQGMINKNKTKMSKSKGNVVSPDDLVKKYGRDSLRLYELFVGPPELDCEWNDSGIEGVFRFLNKFYNFVCEYKNKLIDENKKLVIFRNKLVFEITRRIESLSLNTVVSGLMEFLNDLMDLCKNFGGVDIKTLENFIIMLAPFAPHISEELWNLIGNEKSIFESEWPKYDENNMQDDFVNIALQINGKLRGNISVDINLEREKIILLAKENLGKKLDGKEIVKEIYVPKKIINFVVK